MFISGFHANSDPLMVFFLVLTVYLAEVRACTGWAMVAFAFATGVKVVPIVLFPALFLWCNSWRERVRALLIIATFWLVTAWPWLMHTPAAMMGHIFGYRSPTGLWGIGLLLVESHSDRAWLFNSYGQYLIAVVLVLAAVLMNRGGKRAFLFCQFGVLLFLFHLLTPGFGIQIPCLADSLGDGFAVAFGGRSRYRQFRVLRRGLHLLERGCALVLREFSDGGGRGGGCPR